MTSSSEARPGVLITRPAAQSSELRDAILASGYAVFELPVIEVAALDTGEITAALADLPAADILIFVSPNAVRYGAPLLAKRIATARPLIGAIGPATASALAALKIAVDIEPRGRADSEHLLEHAALHEVAGRNVLIVRGTEGREHLAESLRARGADTRYLAVYQRKTARPAATVIRATVNAFRDGKIAAVIVMSVDSLHGLLEILPDDMLPLLRQSLLVTPSERVIQTVSDRYSDPQTVLADGPQATQLLAALLKYREDTL